jgi:Protein of unknown function (DUF2510)
VTDNTPTDSVPPKRTPSAKTAATAKVPAAKTQTPNAAPAKATPAAKAAPARKPTTAKTVAAVPAVEPAPVVAAAVAVTPPAAVAVAPAGWYPVAAGSAEQRWWDGTRWTEHVYAQPTSVAPAYGQTAAAVRPAVALRAPEGVAPGTIWFWLLAVGAPVLTLLDLIPISVWLGQIIAGVSSSPSALLASEFNPAYVLVLLSGWFIYAVCIVFALLDWRELKARGVPRPFHWGWSFFVIAIGWPVVYVIGRSVVVKRRTGSGLAPLWVFIGLEVVTFVVSCVVIISALLAYVSLLGDALSNAGNVL